MFDANCSTSAKQSAMPRRPTRHPAAKATIRPVKAARVRRRVPLRAGAQEHDGIGEEKEHAKRRQIKGKRRLEVKIGGGYDGHDDSGHSDGRQRETAAFAKSTTAQMSSIGAKKSPEA